MAHQGGYDVKLVSPVPEMYKCSYCNRIMRDPIQTEFGERACGTCYAAAALENAYEQEIFKDRAIQREITKLQCYCHNQRSGCGWTGTLQQLQEHIETCDFFEVQCNQCYDYFLREGLDHHKVNRCPHRKSFCTFCKEKITESRFLEHLGHCLKMPVLCQFGCGTEISHDEFPYHAENECKIIREGKICPYKSISCQTVIAGNEFPRELTFALTQNCKMSLPEIRSPRFAPRDSLPEIEKSEMPCVRLNKFITATDGKIVIVGDKFVDLKDQLKFLQTSMAESKRNSELSSSSRKVSESIGGKTSKAETQLQGHFKNALKNNEEESNKIARDNAIMTSSMIDPDTRMKLLPSSNGHLIWKISDFQRRREDAITGKVTALRSPPCYTHCGGYKFFARVHLNGDGTGKGSHMSVFFVLVKSEFDDLLEWPFQKKISFKLRNCKDQILSHQKTFEPVNFSPSFQKPLKEMNIAAGCPKFILLKRLLAENFINDDCLILETLVESRL